MVGYFSRRGQSMVELAGAHAGAGGDPGLESGVLFRGSDHLLTALNNAARAGVQYGVQSAATVADTNGMQTAATNDTTGITGVTATASEYCQMSHRRHFPVQRPEFMYRQTGVRQGSYLGDVYDACLPIPAFPTPCPSPSQAVMREQ